MRGIENKILFGPRDILPRVSGPRPRNFEKHLRLPKLVYSQLYRSTRSPSKHFNCDNKSRGVMKSFVNIFFCRIKFSHLAILSNLISSLNHYDSITKDIL